MNVKHNSWIGYRYGLTILALCGIIVVGTRSVGDVAFSQSTQGRVEEVRTGGNEDGGGDGNTINHSLRVDVVVTAIEDIKVKPGDTIRKGQVIAERVTARQQLNAQLQQIELSIEKVKGVIEPPLPRLREVLPIKKLPPANYVEEATAISTANIRRERAMSALEFYKRNGMQERVKVVEVDDASRLARDAIKDYQTQAQKINSIAAIEELPPEVTEHEIAILQNKRQDVDKAYNTLALKEAEASSARLSREERLRELQDNVLTASNELQMAIAKLDAAKTRRKQQEFEYSITLARQNSEQNTLNLEWHKAQRDWAETKRRRLIDIAQLSQKLADVKDKLSSLSVVLAPSDGKIVRVKVVKQEANGIRAVIVIAPNNSVINPLPPLPPSSSPLLTSPLPPPPQPSSSLSSSSSSSSVPAPDSRQQH